MRHTKRNEIGKPTELAMDGLHLRVKAAHLKGLLEMSP
jgi:hypothetical protein